MRFRISPLQVGLVRTGVNSHAKPSSPLSIAVFDPPIERVLALLLYLIDPVMLSPPCESPVPATFETPRESILIPISDFTSLRSNPPCVHKLLGYGLNYFYVVIVYST